MTNADKIRMMTDEEMAKFLNHIFDDVCPPPQSISDCLGDKNREPSPEECRNCWLSWLKQEAT